jgi:hypothetical protein
MSSRLSMTALSLNALSLIALPLIALPLIALASAVSLGVERARAATADLTISETGDPTETFSLPLSPLPNPPHAFGPGQGFGEFGVPVVLGGSLATDNLLFLTSTYGASAPFFGFSPVTFTDLVGQSDYAMVVPQLYSGPESSPTFVPAVGVNLFSEVTDTITVTATTSRAPLPGTWMLLLGGLLGLGLFALRSPKKGPRTTSLSG